MNKKQAGMKHGWRSGLEESTFNYLRDKGIYCEFEPYKIPFTQPAKSRTYTPDIVIPTTSGKAMIIETKGRFVTADRMKFKYLIKHHPDLDVRFVFSNANAKISKTSKTTYAKWCDQHGFLWAHKIIPDEWLKEIK